VGGVGEEDAGSKGLGILARERRTSYIQGIKYESILHCKY
jgi:hypothetical protein